MYGLNFAIAQAQDPDDAQQAEYVDEHLRSWLKNESVHKDIKERSVPQASSTLTGEKVGKYLRVSAAR